MKRRSFFAAIGAALAGACGVRKPEPCCCGLDVGVEPDAVGIVIDAPGGEVCNIEQLIRERYIDEFERSLRKACIRDERKLLYGDTTAPQPRGVLVANQDGGDG